MATVPLPPYQKSEKILYSYILQILEAFANTVAILFAQEKDKFFAITAWNL